MALPTTLAVALLLAAVQVLPRFVPTLEGPRRALMLSAAAGFSAAFVFLELLPQLRLRAEAVQDRTDALLGFVEDQTFFLALLGLVVFYGLESLARATRGSGDGATDDPAGLVQILAFSGYYALIGYLLWSQAEESTGELVAYTVAVGVHFLVVDYGLRAHHPTAYRRVGRWALAAAVLIGWSIGALVTVPESLVGVGIAFLAGGVILITLKEELPEEADGRFGAFCGGAVAYTGLLALLALL
jgi:hypothetical protein